MRKIDWEAPLSEEDVAWIRQAGIRTEDQIAAHQAQFGEDVPELEEVEDGVTNSALDPAARVGIPAATGDGPVELVLTEESDEDDDYDQWKLPELRSEVADRNELAADREGVTPVTVEGTGKEGAVTKPDLIKGLRLWDQENPGVI